MAIIENYLKDVPPPQRAELERVWKIILENTPDAEEAITYGMPGFKYKKKYLIAFAAFKDHLSVFPGAAAVAELKPELKDYVVSKGTIQFTLEKPLPESIIRRMVLARMKAIDQK